jgi:tetratricopeptide (TPR) repeat protein
LDRATSLLATTQADASKLLGADHQLTLKAEQVSIATTIVRTDFGQARSRIDALMPRLPAEAIDLKIALLRNSATVASKQHARERALRESRLALQLSRDSGDADEVRTALRNLGSVLLAFDEAPEAVHVYEELLELARARYGDANMNVSAEEAGLSRAYRRSGDLDRAEAHARAAIEIDRKVYAGDHWHVGLHLNALTMLLIQRRKFDEALTAETESLRIERATRGEQTLDALQALGNIGFIHISREDYASALPPLRQALDGATEKYGAEYFTTIRIRMSYGYALAMSGQRRSGEGELDQAIAAAVARTEPDAELVAMTLERRARVALEFGDANAALAFAERMREPAKLVAGKASWQGRFDTLRGEVLLALGRPQDAIVALDAGAAELRNSGDPDAVLRVANPLLRAAAAQAVGDVEHARTQAAQARVLLAALPYPPSRLTRLAASLPG